MSLYSFLYCPHEIMGMIMRMSNDTYICRVCPINYYETSSYYPTVMKTGMVAGEGGSVH